MATLEEMIRAAAAPGVRMTITAIADGSYQGSVSRWAPENMLCNVVDVDPVQALVGALIESERRRADIQRRYEAAPKLGAAVADPLADMFG